MDAVFSRLSDIGAATCYIPLNSTVDLTLVPFSQNVGVQMTMLKASILA